MLKTIEPDKFASNLTKRELFAITILNGLIAREPADEYQELYQPLMNKEDFSMSQQMAIHAVRMADDLTAELAKK